MRNEGFPGWWDEGVRVVDKDEVFGTLCRIAGTWCVQPDGDPNPGSRIPVSHIRRWSVVVDSTLTPSQLKGLAYDAERALLRSFGCHYIAEWSSVPEIQRTQTDPRPRPVGRPELAGLQAVVRGAILDALKPYVR